MSRLLPEMCATRRSSISVTAISACTLMMLFAGGLSTLQAQFLLDVDPPPAATSPAADGLSDPNGAPPQELENPFGDATEPETQAAEPSEILPATTLDAAALMEQSPEPLEEPSSTKSGAAELTPAKPAQPAAANQPATTAWWSDWWQYWPWALGVLSLLILWKLLGGNRGNRSNNSNRRRVGEEQETAKIGAFKKSTRFAQTDTALDEPGSDGQQIDNKSADSSEILDFDVQESSPIDPAASEIASVGDGSDDDFDLDFDEDTVEGKTALNLDDDDVVHRNAPDQSDLNFDDIEAGGDDDLLDFLEDDDKPVASRETVDLDNLSTVEIETKAPVVPANLLDTDGKVIPVSAPADSTIDGPPETVAPDQSDSVDSGEGDEQSSSLGSAALAAVGTAAGLGAVFVSGNAGASDQQSEPNSGDPNDDLLNQVQLNLEKLKATQAAKQEEIQSRQTEIDRLKDTLEATKAEKNTQIEELNAKLEELSSKASTGDEAKEKLQQDVSTLEAKLQESETAAADLKTAADAKAKEFEELKVSHEKSRAEIEQQRQDDQTAAEGLAKEQELNKTQLAEIDALKKKLDDAETIAAQKSKAIEELEASQAEIEQQRQDDQSAAEGLAKEQELNKTQLAELESLKKQLDDAETSAVAKSKSIEELEKTLGQLQDENEELKTEKAAQPSDEQLAAAAAAAASSDGEDVAKLTAKLAEEAELRENTQQMLLEAEDQRTDVAIALSKLKKQMKAQEAAANESKVDPAVAEKLEKVEAELSQSKAKAETLQDDVEKLRKQIAQENEIAKDLQGKLESSDKKVSDATRAQEEWASKFAEVDAELGVKKKEAEQLTAALAEKQQLEQQLSEAKTQLDEKDAEVQNFQTTVNDLQEKSGRLSYAQLEEALASVASLSAEREVLGKSVESLAEVRQQNAVLEDRIVGMSGQLEAALKASFKLEEKEREASAQQETIASTRADNAKLKERVHQLEKQTAQSQAIAEKVETLNASLESRSASLATAEKENAALVERMNQLTKQSEEAKQAFGEIETYREKVADLSQRKTALTERNEALAKQAQLAEKTLEKNEELNQKLGALQTAIEAAEKRSADLQQQLTTAQSKSQPTAAVDSSTSVGLVKIFDQLQAQNQQINQLVSENTRAAAELTELKLAQQASSKPRRSPKIPEGYDDLSKIKGIGPQFRQKLYDVGIRSFSQIAAWSDADVDDYCEKLNCSRGRVEREKWIHQAKKLL